MSTKTTRDLDELLPVRDRDAEKRARREAFRKAHRAYEAMRTAGPPCNQATNAKEASTNGPR